MSVYTEVTLSTMQDWADKLELGKVVSITAAKHGIQNTNYFVTTKTLASEKKFVVTVIETLPLPKVAFYLQQFEILAHSGVPMPTALPHLAPRLFEVEGKATAWFPQLPGEHPTEPSLTQAKKLAAALAKLHIQGNTMKSQGLPTFIQLHTQPWMKAAGRSWLQAKLDLLTDFYQQWPSLPTGVIHSDLFRDNTLFEGNNLTGVLDFYDIKYGPLLVDLATSLNDWCWIPADINHTEYEKAFLQSYELHRKLTNQERKWLQCAKLEAAIRFWYSRTHQAWLITYENPDLVGHDPAPMQKLADGISISLAQQ